jgi:hypothetical protein
MDPAEGRKREEQFVDAWKSWMRQPPRHTPREAAARVVARLPKRSRGQPWWLLAAAAVVLAAALTVHWTAVTRRAAGTGVAGDRLESAPMGEGEVLIWLDEKTPLYMTFQPPGEAAARQDGS